MKMTALSMVLIGIGLCTVQAGLPMPCVNYHGRLSDEYGAPYLEYAEIFLLTVPGGVECDRHEIKGLLAGGVNYELQLEIDSGGSPYAPYAVHVGDAVRVVVKVGGVEQPALSPVNVVHAANPGESVVLNLFTGTDSDGDDLPDAWEELLMSQSDGALTNIQQVTKSGDFDGDGASNWSEFLAGTFPFLAYDVFAIDGMELVNGRIGFEFLAIRGKVYQVQLASDLAAGDWENGAFALDEVSDATETVLPGEGGFKTIYIDIEENTRFVRLTAE